ncbi:hypothetical protein ACPZ19_10590 [Amycolatopsis lurida]
MSDRGCQEPSRPQDRCTAAMFSWLQVYTPWFMACISSWPAAMTCWQALLISGLAPGIDRLLNTADAAVHVRRKAVQGTEHREFKANAINQNNIVSTAAQEQVRSGWEQIPDLHPEK